MQESVELCWNQCIDQFTSLIDNQMLIECDLPSVSVNVPLMIRNDDNESMIIIRKMVCLHLLCILF